MAAESSNDDYPTPGPFGLPGWRERTEEEQEMYERALAAWGLGMLEAVSPLPEDDADLDRKRQMKPLTIAKALRVMWGFVGRAVLPSVAIVSLTLAVAAYYLPEHSLEQLIAIELAGGGFTFLLLPLVLTFTLLGLGLTRFLVTLVIIGAAFAASDSKGVTQHLFVEAALAFGMILGLELTIREGKKGADRRQAAAAALEKRKETDRRAKIDLEQKARDDERARREETAEFANPTIVGHGFGDPPSPEDEAWAQSLRSGTPEKKPPA